MSGLVLDLFAGPGGWDVAAAQLGLVPLGVEVDRHACATATAAGHRRVQADVSALSPWEFVNAHGADHVSGIIASPPCGTFSVAGKGRGRAGKPVILDGVARIAAGEDPTAVCKHVDDALASASASLVLEPLRWALELEPTWVALEQVTPVLPLWEAVAGVLRADGWNTDTGVLSAEQYDVPQTRRRAFLVAHRGRVVQLPAPVRRRYRKGTAQHEVHPADDADLAPWVSMADALGWTGVAGFPRRDDGRAGGSITLDGQAYRARDLRPAELPAQVVTEKARSWSRWPAAQRWQLAPPAPFRSQDRTQPRNLGEPSLTVAFGNNATGWQWRSDTPDQPPVRVTVTEAAALQGFPPDYPWAGTATAQFRQVGDAVPPPLAAHVLRSVIEPVEEAAA